ncbi:MAG TPA: hypothetical protein VJ881_00465 [Halanaerobiales bacterium]|nr:hypothetical protein [Halanaerobiales bacterium]
MTCKEASALVGTEVKKHLVSLGPGIWGMLYYSSKGKYHILINKNLNEKKRKKALIHELKHLIVDLKPGLYVIGFGAQKDKMEMNTNFWANKFHNILFEE